MADCGDRQAPVAPAKAEPFASKKNFGFTDIVIGRKHADAPYDDGKDIWDGLAAPAEIRRT